MVLVDSNIIIYGIHPDYQSVRDYLAQQEIAVSDITFIEVLGFHALTEKDEKKLKQLFSVCHRYGLDAKVIEQAINLRQQKKISLGDTIIAATALEHELLLVTANEEDFDWIADLKIHNPVTS
ncbi:type II toxin-antitoxin system VapC family toxin [Tunicatimonas pelagia]|uniref:type II toxin-antitoxin system VapC family toxin n=1 Tax=Tunicatimonas pelagia TaxID=931531 RepID=UPI0026669826|nr:type II toxin-antitoxin system VapC family toxin [Tunicatimonas pelagia]WKN40744.1 type II toxin-antitoxin system VapC family toxin [Tunicatimonas pelagia]